MIIERINNEVVVRIPSFVRFDEIQRMIDLMCYKEAVARSKAKQADVDKLAKEVNKGWWKKNRERFMQ
ncbi:hypothetical protein FACS1894177_03200 [Bacteroidia bacterium]|nr:hypothetical protein FACS189426_07100 [Bacteroidia bacterium]GHV30501.1 hypothetical protein FACS1894177_03200 [Bacteroidia bacterium]GHV71623.1 hypothetical protein FACS189420_7340 [Bacteroidia bacterium]